MIKKFIAWLKPKKEAWEGKERRKKNKLTYCDKCGWINAETDRYIEEQCPACRREKLCFLEFTPYEVLQLYHDKANNLIEIEALKKLLHSPDEEKAAQIIELNEEIKILKAALSAWTNRCI